MSVRLVDMQLVSQLTHKAQHAQQDQLQHPVVVQSHIAQQGAAEKLLEQLKTQQTSEPAGPAIRDEHQLSRKRRYQAGKRGSSDQEPKLDVRA